MEKTQQFETDAVVTIYGAAKMTTKGRHSIALWLRRTAADLERNGNEMASPYRARYLHPKGK